MSSSQSSTHNNNNNNNKNREQQQERSSNLRRACASCKFQRKRCDDSCILHPYFTSDKSQEFEASHKIFGVSNMNKMLSQIPTQDRWKAVESIVWEALRWKEDPVNGPLRFYKNLVQETVFYKNLVQERDFYKNQLNQANRQKQQLLNHNHALILSNNSYNHHTEEPVPLATNCSNYNYCNINNGNLEYGTAGASSWSADGHSPLPFQETDSLRILGPPSNPPPVMLNYNPILVVRNGNNAVVGPSSSGFVQSHPQQILINQQKLGGNDLDFYGSTLVLPNGDVPTATTTSLLPPRMGGPYFAPPSRHQVAATRDGDGSSWTTNQIGQGSNAFNHRNDNRDLWHMK